MNDQELISYCESHLRLAPQPRFVGSMVKRLAELADEPTPSIPNDAIVGENGIRELCGKARTRLEKPS